VDVTVTQKTGLLNKISSFTFEVEDNGIGISKPTLECIFDPFIRESNSTESGVFGAGLGLTIVKQMVDAMRGTIRAESTLGEGSTFTVTLGLKPDLSEYTEEAQDDPEDLSGKKILIVEDNEINLEIETEILSDYGFIIDSAENGKIAVDKIIAAGQDGYDLILMDIQMPIMDGRTATREIRGLKDHPLSKIPIIALSANAFESDRRESIEAGMDSHINKPLDVEVLLAAIRAALKTRKAK
ncbi:MAG: response regulator, partial [Clostridiales bacterium]|nr:response regulator [Clostridiales bacterium]